MDDPMEDEMECEIEPAPLRVSIAALRERACPVRTPPWSDDDPVREEDVRQALAEDRLHGTPLGPNTTTREMRAARIAWLIKHGWPDPIELDFGVPGFPGYNPLRWIVDDGNHRLYAAILAGEETILAHAGGLQAEIDTVLA